MDTARIEELRRDTPGVQHVIHLNNAGSSLMPGRVWEAVTGYIESEARIGGYETFSAYEQELEGFYKNTARLINADPEEIAFAESATRAWQLAFYSLDFKQGDRILTSRSEYASNYISYLQISRRYGVSVEPVPNSEEGFMSTKALEEMLDSRVKLVSLTHIPTNSGLVNPAAEVGKLLEQHPALYLLDACQSAGQVPLDVEEIGCEILSATGRKYLRGPRGTGFLFMKKELLEKTEPVMLDLHSATWTGPAEYEIRPDARRFENWEVNFAGKRGLDEAVRYALEVGPEAIWKRVQMLAGRLRENLRGIGGVGVKDPGTRLCGIVSIDCGDITARNLVNDFRMKGINLSVSPPDSTLLDSIDRNLNPLVRASVHYYNTMEEIDRFTDELRNYIHSG